MPRNRWDPKQRHRCEVSLDERFVRTRRVRGDVSSDGWRTTASGTGRGIVYLVGAGPGDPDLLTLRALKLIKRANVALYDNLISAEILALLPKRAERIYVGKRRACHAMRQEAINELLVERARRDSACCA